MSNDESSLDELITQIHEATGNIYAALLEGLRLIFNINRLNLDRKRLAALDLVLTLPGNADLINETDGDTDPVTQEMLDEEYRAALDIAMPIIRYLIPEVYSLEQQQAIYDRAEAHARLDTTKEIPIETAAGTELYDSGILRIMLHDPNMGLSKDDMRMLVVFRITLSG